MKQKNLTGLRARVYRESSKKSVLFDLLASVLIFLALAAVCYTVSGFSAMLWLLGAGILTCIAAAIIRHFQKTKLLFPILLAALLLVVLFARNPLLNGFGAAWNTLRDLWAAEKGILLPLAETDGTSLWLTGIVAGLLLAMMSVVLSRVPTLTAVLLAALSVAAAFVQPDFLLLAAAAIALLMLTWQKNKNAVSAASFLLVGVIVAGIAAISLQTGTMQALSQSAKDSLHHWRYEKAEEVLPEGDLSEPVVKTESTDTILSVTADTAQTLYLLGNLQAQENPREAYGWYQKLRAAVNRGLPDPRQLAAGSFRTNYFYAKDPVQRLRYLVLAAVFGSCPDAGTPEVSDGSPWNPCPFRQELWRELCAMIRQNPHRFLRDPLTAEVAVLFRPELIRHVSGPFVCGERLAMRAFQRGVRRLPETSRREPFRLTGPPLSGGSTGQA